MKYIRKYKDKDVYELNDEDGVEFNKTEDLISYSDDSRKTKITDKKLYLNSLTFQPCIGYSVLLPDDKNIMICTDSNEYWGNRNNKDIQAIDADLVESIVNKLRLI